MQLGREIEAKSFSEFDQDIRDISELATQTERGWALDMKTNTKGFKEYEIKEVFACS